MEITAMTLNLRNKDGVQVRILDDGIAVVIQQHLSSESTASMGVKMTRLEAEGLMTNLQWAICEMRERER